MMFTKNVNNLLDKVNSLWAASDRYFKDIIGLMKRANKQDDRMDSMVDEVTEVREHSTRTARRAYNLETVVGDLQNELARLKKDYDFLEDAFVKAHMKVIQLDKAAGGFWKTASGYTMRIRDMSTNHIKRCLAGNFGGPLSRTNLDKELKRRKEEEVWRKKPMPGKPPSFPPVESVQEEGEDGFQFNNGDDLAKTVIEPEDEEEFVGRIDGTPVYVDANIGILQVARVKAFIDRGHQARLL